VVASRSGSLGSVRSTCGVPEAGPRSHVPVEQHLVVLPPMPAKGRPWSWNPNSTSREPPVTSERSADRLLASGLGFGEWEVRCVGLCDVPGGGCDSGWAPALAEIAVETESPTAQGARMFKESLPTVRETEKGLEHDDASIRLGLFPADLEIRRLTRFPPQRQPPKELLAGFTRSICHVARVSQLHLGRAG
jgi:hypothetical protein